MGNGGKRISHFFFYLEHVISKCPKDSAQNQVISKRFLRFKPEFFTITWSINVSYKKFIKKKTWNCSLFDLDQIGILLALKRLVFLHYGLGKLDLWVQLIVFLYYTLHHGLIFSIQGHSKTFWVLKKLLELLSSFFLSFFFFFFFGFTYSICPK